MPLREEGAKEEGAVARNYPFSSTQDDNKRELQKNTDFHTNKCIFIAFLDKAEIKNQFKLCSMCTGRESKSREAAQIKAYPFLVDKVRSNSKTPQGRFPPYQK